MKKSKRRLLQATVPVAMGFILISSASAATTSTQTNKSQLRGGHMQKRDHADSALANILGMTETDLKTALSSGKTIDTLITEKGLNKDTVMQTLRAEHEARMSARLAADVSSGKITQAEADKMKAEHTTREAKHKETLATALGISVATLEADMKAGFTLDAISAKYGTTGSLLKAKLDAAREADMKANLAADVASGKITQAQADQMLTNKSKGHSKGGPKGLR